VGNLAAVKRKRQCDSGLLELPFFVRHIPLALIFPWFAGLRVASLLELDWWAFALMSSNRWCAAVLLLD